MSDSIELAVVGAHLSGMPLNRQLTERFASLIRATRTAPYYKLYVLPGTVPAKPGLLRVHTRQPNGIEVEIWRMDAEAFGTFVAAIPSPLGIGTVTMEDGTSVKCFLVEAYAVEGAIDITTLGGWRRYLAEQPSPQ